MEKIIKVYGEAMHSRLILLVFIAIVCDTIFGVLRAIKEKKFNSCFGINGAIRKVAMIITMFFLIPIDALTGFNLIGFIPVKFREATGITTCGLASFFGILYLCYESISILKNMVLCGLPFKKIWEKLKTVMQKYTKEIPIEIPTGEAEQAAAEKAEEKKE